jgi:hypothetical protein
MAAYLFRPFRGHQAFTQVRIEADDVASARRQFRRLWSLRAEGIDSANLSNERGNIFWDSVQA